MDKKDKKQIKSQRSEVIKYVLLSIVAAAILVGSFFLFWQIQKQNKTVDDPYAGAQKMQSEVSSLNKKIDDLNKALQDAKKENVETKVTTSTKSGSVAGAETEAKTEGEDGSESQSQEETSGLVNINSASAAQLDTLPGIGAAYSQRIIDYRDANGGFKSTEELKNVKGIGDKTFDKLKDLVTI